MDQVVEISDPDRLIMDPNSLIEKYYQDLPLAREILYNHSSAVAEKSIIIAKSLGMTKQKIRFIYEAAMLHDIGIFLVYSPEIGCYGKHPYICHGYLGHDLLVREGFPKHAKICERHTGTGIGKKEIILRGLPIPLRSMKPKTLCEKIITYSDKFFSKNPDKLGEEKSVKKIREKLSKHGHNKIIQFDEWHEIFKI